MKIQSRKPASPPVAPTVRMAIENLEIDPYMLEPTLHITIMVPLREIIANKKMSTSELYDLLNEKIKVFK